MATAKFSNNASTTLYEDIDTSQTQIRVIDSSDFPALGADEFFTATLEKATGDMEIVQVTAVGSDVTSDYFTVVRDYETVPNTTPVAFSTGDRIELRITAGGLNGLGAGSDVIQYNSQIIGTNNGSTTNTYVYDFDPAITNYTDGLELLFYPNANNTGAATLDAGNGAQSIVYYSGDTLEADALRVNKPTKVIYATNISAWVLQSGGIDNDDLAPQGSGSGLDADLLDGQEASEFMLLGTGDTSGDVAIFDGNGQVQPGEGNAVIKIDPATEDNAVVQTADGGIQDAGVPLASVSFAKGVVSLSGSLENKIANPLGVLPDIAIVVAKCLADVGGFDAGQEVPLTTTLFGSDDSTDDNKDFTRGASFWVSASEMGCRAHNDRGLVIVGMDNSIVTISDSNSWEIEFRLTKFSTITTP